MKEKHMQTTSAVIRSMMIAGSLVGTLAAPALAGGPTTTAPEPVIIPAAEPYVAPGIDWSGAYAGAQIGYADTDTTGGALDGHGMLGGVHAGYRWDMGNFVAGVELDHDIASVDLGATPGDTLDDVTRLKLTAGTEMGNALLYGALGGAHARATVGGLDLADNGYFLGAGVTYALTDSWTVGGELLQHQFSDFDGSGVDLDATTVSARVGFRF
jgi:outer membrane immunogenic protein